MTVERIDGGYNNKIKRVQRKKAPAKPAGASRTDSVQLSDEARKVAQDKKLHDIVKNAPVASAKNIGEIKARLESGSYLTEKVAEAIAEKIIQALGIG